MCISNALSMQNGSMKETQLKFLLILRNVVKGIVEIALYHLLYANVYY